MIHVDRGQHSKESYFLPANSLRELRLVAGSDGARSRGEPGSVPGDASDSPGIGELLSHAFLSKFSVMCGMFRMGLTVFDAQVLRKGVSK